MKIQARALNEQALFSPQPIVPGDMLRRVGGITLAPLGIHGPTHSSAAKTPQFFGEQLLTNVGPQSVFDTTRSILESSDTDRPPEELLITAIETSPPETP